MRLEVELKKPKYHNDIMMSLLENNKIPSDKFDYKELLKKFNEYEYKWQPPKRALIPKPNGKMREIFIFNENDSILQKIITAILYNNKGHLLSDSVYSYKKGVSIFSVGRIIKESKKNLVFAKMDISNYFLSVNRRTLDNAINELFRGDLKGRKLIRDLFGLNKFIDSKTGEIVDRYLSIMPGCALSSYLANYILTDVDNLMAHNCDFYCRYSDDILIGAESERKLNSLIDILTERLAELGLSINPSKTVYFDKNEAVDYLGLLIDDKEINLNKSNSKQLKSLVKEVCKRNRKECEITKGNPKTYVEKSIRELNGKFYKSVFDLSQKHKGNRAMFIFNSVTNMKSLQEIDFYIKDRLNYVMSGKNNKKVYINQDDLEQLGYLSLTSMCIIYKKDRDIFLWKCWYSDKKEYIQSNYSPMSFPNTYESEELIYTKNVMSLITMIINNHYLICDEEENKVYNYNDLRIDYTNKSISYGDLFLIRNGIKVLEKVKVLGKSKSFYIDFGETYVIKVSKDLTEKLYLQYCASNTMGNRIQYNFTRKIRKIDLYNLYEEYDLDYNMPEDFARLQFFLYLYSVSINNDWGKAGFEDKLGFKKLTDNNLIIVLPKE